MNTTAAERWPKLARPRPERPETPSRPRDSGSGFRLGQVRGIEVRLDWTLAFIFFLIVVNLGAGLFPRLHPQWSPALTWLLALATAVLFLASILTHELAHALVGRRLGVPIEGITLFLFGGVSRLKAEPATARAELWMALAGPATSLVIGLLSLGIGSALVLRGGEPSSAAEVMRRAGPAATLLLWLGPVNLLLAVFNMLPGFPLDGGRVLRALLWRITGSLQKATRVATGVGRALGLTFVALGVLMMFGTRVPWLGGGLVQGLWLAFIGWFLASAALRSYQQVMLRSMLEGVTVDDLTRPAPPPIRPELPLADVAERFMNQADERCLFVADTGDDRRLLGVVCLSDLKRVPRVDWAALPARAVMTPLEALEVVNPREDVGTALAKLSARDVDQLPVVEDGRLLGMLRRAEVIRWLELQVPTARAGR